MVDNFGWQTTPVRLGLFTLTKSIQLKLPYYILYAARDGNEKTPRGFSHDIAETTWRQRELIKQPHSTFKNL